MKSLGQEELEKEQKGENREEATFSSCATTNSPEQGQRKLRAALLRHQLSPPGPREVSATAQAAYLEKGWR